MKIKNIVPIILALLIIVFCYENSFGNNVIYSYLTLISILAFIFDVIYLIKNAPLKLSQDEKLIKEYKKISWTGKTALSYDKWSSQHMVLTNKRIITGGKIMGMNTYFDMISYHMFYNEDDFKKYDGRGSIALLADLQMKDGYVFMKGKAEAFSQEIEWTFKDDAEFIFQTVKEYRK